MGGSFRNFLSRKCERANRWGAAKSYCRGNLRGKGEGLKRGRRRALPGVRSANGRPKSYFQGDGKWGAGGLAKNYSRGNRDGGRGGGGRRNEKPFPQLGPPARIADGLQKFAEPRDPATQGARRRRLPRMRDMPPQCVLGDFRRSASEIRSPWFDAP